MSGTPRNSRLPPKTPNRPESSSSFSVSGFNSRTWPSPSPRRAQFDSSFSSSMMAGDVSSGGGSSESDNIQVIVRIRPELSDVSSRACVRSDSSQTAVVLHSQPTDKTFTFDWVADEETSQETVFLHIGQPMVQKCLQGYNATVFAYGQTGSGKTYTMQGPAHESEIDATNTTRGLIPRILDYTFGLMAKNERECKEKNETLTYITRASYLEIYNETITDLLDNSMTHLSLREDIRRGVYVDGASEETVYSAVEAYNLLRRGAHSRRVGTTAMNRESSRSHAVFSLSIEGRHEHGELVNHRTSRLHLIDLAGSERQQQTATSGTALKEACNINRSLSHLGQVISALSDIAMGKQRHVHYRDSKLTFLLKDSLGGNTKTCVIATISGDERCHFETHSTLKFAQRAKFIRNKISINEDVSGNTSALQNEVNRLKAELHTTKEKLVLAERSGTQQHRPTNDRLLLHPKLSTLPSISNTNSKENRNSNNNDEQQQDENVTMRLETLLCEALDRVQSLEREAEAERSKLEEILRVASHQENTVRNIDMRYKFCDSRLKKLQANAMTKLELEDSIAKENEALQNRAQHFHNATVLAAENLELRAAIESMQNQLDNPTKVQGQLQRSKKHIQDLTEQLNVAMRENIKLKKTRQTFSTQLHDLLSPNKLAGMTSPERRELETSVDIETYKMTQPLRDELSALRSANKRLTRDRTELEEKINSMDQQLLKAKSQCVEAENALDAMKMKFEFEVEQYTQEICTLTEKNKNAEQNELEEALHQSRVSHEELTRLQHQNDVLKNQLEHVMKTSERQSQRVNQLQTEAKKATEQRETAMAELAALQTEFSQMEMTHINEVHELNETATHQRQRFEQLQMELKEQKAQFDTKLIQAEEEKSQLNAQLETVTDELSEIKDQFETLSEEFEHMKAVTEAKDMELLTLRKQVAVTSDQTNYQQQVEELQQQLEVNQSKLVESQQNVKEISDLFQEKLEEVKEKESELSKSKQEIVYLEEELKNQTQVAEECRAELEEAQQQYQKLLKDREEVEQHHQNRMRETMEELEKEHVLRMQSEDELIRVKEDVVKMSNEHEHVLKQKEDELDSLKSNIQQLTMQLEEKQEMSSQDRESLVKELEVHKRRSREIRRLSDEWEGARQAKNREIEMLRAELEEKEEKLKNLTAEYEQIVSAYESLQQEHATVEQQLEEGQNRVVALNEDVGQLRLRLDESIQEQQKNLQEMQRISSEEVALYRQIDELKKSNNMLDRDCAYYKRKTEELTDENAKLVGHHNEKQRIQHHMKVKNELAQLQTKYHEMESIYVKCKEELRRLKKIPTNQELTFDEEEFERQRQFEKYKAETEELHATLSAAQHNLREIMMLMTGFNNDSASSDEILTLDTQAGITWIHDQIQIWMRELMNKEKQIDLLHKEKQLVSRMNTNHGMIINKENLPATPNVQPSGTPAVTTKIPSSVKAAESTVAKLYRGSFTSTPSSVNKRESILQTLFNSTSIPSTPSTPIPRGMGTPNSFQRSTTSSANKIVTSFSLGGGGGPTGGNNSSSRPNSASSGSSRIPSKSATAAAAAGAGASSNSTTRSLRSSQRQT